MKPLILAALLGLTSVAAQAEPTHVMVRAQSQDAKFIGSAMGGVKVTVTDARTGAVLATGLTQGGTGDTETLMRAPKTRNQTLSEGKTAGFDAVIDIDRPTLVRVDATGPIGKPASAISVASSLWVLPGHDIGGDGLILTFPGLVIEPLPVVARNGTVNLSAKVTLMCGCPIEPGGLWDSAHYAVEAVLLQGDRTVARATLAYAGQASQFSGTIPPSATGDYTLRLTAADSRTSNVGVVEQPLTIPAR